MAKGVIVRLVAINVQQPLTIAAAAAGVAPTMCTHPRCQRLAATIVEERKWRAAMAAAASAARELGVEFE